MLNLAKRLKKLLKSNLSLLYITRSLPETEGFFCGLTPALSEGEGAATLGCFNCFLILISKPNPYYALQ